MIDRRREPAIYRRIADDLARRIRSGELAPGDLLPSADLVCRTYGVGMMTANRAIQELKYDGLVDTESGQRTRVRADPPKELVRLVRSATMDLRMPTPEEREEFGLREGVPVAEVEWGRPAERRRRVYPGDRYRFTTE